MNVIHGALSAGKNSEEDSQPGSRGGAAGREGVIVNESPRKRTLIRLHLAET